MPDSNSICVRGHDARELTNTYDAVVAAFFGVAVYAAANKRTSGVRDPRKAGKSAINARGDNC
jgi:hypothetical protein